MQVLKMGHLCHESLDFKLKLINIRAISNSCHTK